MVIIIMIYDNFIMLQLHNVLRMRDKLRRR